MVAIIFLPRINMLFLSTTATVRYILSNGVGRYLGEQEWAHLVVQLGRGVMIYMYLFYTLCMLDVISYVVDARQEFMMSTFCINCNYVNPILTVLHPTSAPGPTRTEKEHSGKSLCSPTWRAESLHLQTRVTSLVHWSVMFLATISTDVWLYFA